MPVQYGTCIGGPFDGRKLIEHDETVSWVAVEAWSRKIAIGVQLGTPGYEFGRYDWKDNKWHWTSPAAVSSRASSPSPSPRRP